MLPQIHAHVSPQAFGQQRSAVKPRTLRAPAGFPHRVFQVVFSANVMALTKLLPEKGLSILLRTRATATHKTPMVPLASKAIKRPVLPQAESWRGALSGGPGPASSPHRACSPAEEPDRGCLGLSSWTLTNNDRNETGHTLN